MYISVWSYQRQYNILLWLPIMTDEQKLTGQLLVNNSNRCTAETADQKQTFKEIPNWPSEASSQF